MQIRAEFIDYIRRVENGSKDGYNSGIWSPHTSPEGGNDTIGYGHKMRNDEEWMKAGVPDEQIENLLLSDIIKAAEDASEVINEYGSGDFEGICQYCQEMFTDFVFNLGSNGLRRFPKFVNATLDHDTKTMKQEYKRYYRDGSGAVKELEHRNQEFANMFL